MPILPLKCPKADSLLTLQQEMDRTLAAAEVQRTLNFKAPATNHTHTHEKISSLRIFSVHCNNFLYQCSVTALVEGFCTRRWQFVGAYPRPYAILFHWISLLNLGRSKSYYLLRLEYSTELLSTDKLTDKSYKKRIYILFLNRNNIFFSKARNVWLLIIMPRLYCNAWP